MRKSGLVLDYVSPELFLGYGSSVTSVRVQILGLVLIVKFHSTSQNSYQNIKNIYEKLGNS